MVPPHAASIALDQDSLTVTLGIVRDIVTEVATFEEISTYVWSSLQFRREIVQSCFSRLLVEESVCLSNLWRRSSSQSSR